MYKHTNEKTSEHMTDMLKSIKSLRTKVFEQDAIIRKYGEPFEGDKMDIETSSSSASALGTNDSKESINSISPPSTMVSSATSRQEVRNTRSHHKNHFSK